jgi:hypothetical protein
MPCLRCWPRAGSRTCDPTRPVLNRGLVAPFGRPVEIVREPFLRRKLARNGSVLRGLASKFSNFLLSAHHQLLEARGGIVRLVSDSTTSLSGL